MRKGVKLCKSSQLFLKMDKKKYVIILYYCVVMENTVYVQKHAHISDVINETIHAANICAGINVTIMDNAYANEIVTNKMRSYVKYNCEVCNFTSKNKRNYENHLVTPKHLHKNRENGTINIPNTCGCGKVYKHRSGLCIHRKTCINKAKLNVTDIIDPH